MEAVQSMLGEAPALLSQVYEAYSLIPVWALLAAHCLCVASMFRQLRDRFLLSYWVRVFSARI